MRKYEEKIKVGKHQVLIRAKEFEITCSRNSQFGPVYIRSCWVPSEEGGEPLDGSIKWKIVSGFCALTKEREWVPDPSLPSTYYKGRSFFDNYHFDALQEAYEMVKPWVVQELELYPQDEE